MILSDINDNVLPEDLVSFLKTNEFTGSKLRLLLFWGRHPQAKFNIDSIAHVMDTTRLYLREIMQELIKNGIIKEQYCASGIAHYSLNHEHSFSQHVEQLAELDWSAIKSLEEKIEKVPVPA